jgi:hypothetical protein
MTQVFDPKNIVLNLLSSLIMMLLFPAMIISLT